MSTENLRVFMNGSFKPFYSSYFNCNIHNALHDEYLFFSSSNQMSFCCVLSWRWLVWPKALTLTFS